LLYRLFRPDLTPEDLCKALLIPLGYAEIEDYLAGQFGPGG